MGFAECNFPRSLRYVNTAVAQWPWIMLESRVASGKTSTISAKRNFNLRHGGTQAPSGYRVNSCKTSNRRK